MKRFYLLLLCFMLSSCATKSYAPIVRTQKIVDTVTRMVSDSAVMRALFECDSIGRVRMRELNAYKGSTASQQVDFNNGELKVETRWRTQYIDRISEMHDTITVVDYRTQIKEIRHIPQFFWWTFAIALIALLYILWRIIRKFK